MAKKRIVILGIEARKLLRRAKAVKYRDDMPARAERLCRVHGFTRKDLADAFGTHLSTIWYWMRKHPEFHDAIIKGRDAFDSTMAEDALIRRVKGYNLVETTEELQKVVEYDFIEGKDKVVEKLVPVKRVHKHLPPDVGAIKMWLTSRHQDRWPMEKQQIDATLKGTIEVITGIDRAPNDS